MIFTLTDCLYVLSGFFVGLLVGLTGVGGGSLMTPILVLLFGVHPVTAVGTDLLFATSTKTVGTLLHGLSRNIDWRIVGLLATGSVPATTLALLALAHLDLRGGTASHFVTVALAIVLLITASFLLFARSLRATYANRLNKLSPRLIAFLTIALGAIMGLLVTTTSVGAGAVGVTVLLFLFPNLPTSRIVGSDIAHAVPLTLIAGLGHWLLGSIDWGLLTPLLTGSLPGIAIGSMLVGRISDMAARTALALILIVASVRLIV